MSKRKAERVHEGDMFESKFSGDPKMNSVLAAFSNKGGVGKTTFTSNLVSMLNREDPNIGGLFRKILLVDFDTQLNLTCFHMSDKEFENELDKQAKYFRLLDDGEVKDDDRANILQVIKSNVNPDPIRLNRYKGSTQVYMIKGSISFEQIEDEINLSIASRQLKDITEKVKRFFKRCRRDYDLTILDLSPSLNSFNHLLLGLSDGVVSPCVNDLFSRMSFAMLHRKFTKKPIPFLKMPFMIGYFLNRVETIRGELIKAEESHRKKFNKKVRDLFDEDVYLGFIENYGSLNIRLQEKRLTIPELHFMKSSDIFLSQQDEDSLSKLDILYGQLREITIEILERMKMID